MGLSAERLARIPDGANDDQEDAWSEGSLTIPAALPEHRPTGFRSTKTIQWRTFLNGVIDCHFLPGKRSGRAQP